MIFAELDYPESYENIHDELVNFISLEFSNVQSGLQGDSWIWIFSESEKVVIDTFLSMKHEIKSDHLNSRLVIEVINHLKKRFVVNVYGTPEPEPHEE
ncbi:hypothetical protein [Simiduia agarivorans]|uniref:Uncharacterized protein n=1 Tax=Simiduia agarivorans (strain DSM 21679 / JCM 13881 / BCRC 17597 / SA1) TaxID=1117647 RepID=R9S5D0_SIMAS|nr:hypothetical protein [Simiduia agarivorans]AGN11346.1 hypothetical protein M5M_13462 [Simiduia agarivorans SA1 = DSM 21679]